MSTSSFITELAVNPASWAHHTSAHEPLALVQCRFSVDAYHDEAFVTHGIPQPDRLQRAVAKRRSEFLAGRVCAQHALAQLGTHGLAGSIDKRRDPIWPVGYVGAITHSHGVAAALVGPQSHWQGIGLDVEHWIAPESARHLSSAILEPHETALLSNDDAIFAKQLTLIFSAKESVFKALNPVTGTSFYFHDASLVALNEQSLQLRLDCTLDGQWQAGALLTCHYAQHSAYVMTWLTITAPALT